MRHRGPDDEGYLFANTATGRLWLAGGTDTPNFVWNSNYAYTPKYRVDTGNPRHANLAMTSRRLAIQDLSAAGHQPMCNEDESLWIVFNGEIYNFRDLRSELKSLRHEFVSHSDTEVILHAYEQWGPDCLQHFNGMWAFAIWDRNKQSLFCSRDRFGVKPFYYWFDSGAFVFSSEIKAILKSGLVSRDVNECAIADYLLTGIVDHGCDTFFSRIQRLAPGACVELRAQGAPRVWRYYDLTQRVQPATENGHVRQLYDLFEDSVRLRLISDVPVGSCLSGGLDSSSIVCVAANLIRENGLKLPGGQVNQKTFSARYEDPRCDEGDYISQVSGKTGSDAYFTYPAAGGLFEDISDLIWCQEEPFGSTSVYAQWRVFKLVRETGVTVVLDGLGGDELFAGYSEYLSSLFSYLIRTVQIRGLSTELRAHLHAYGSKSYRTLLLSMYSMLPQPLKALKRAITGHAYDFLNVEVIENANRCGPQWYDGVALDSIFDRHLYRSLSYSGLPSYLRYEDKNSMVHSVESRLPFLDYRFVEFAFSLPWHEKIHHATTKYLLRKAMTGILPEQVRNRRDKIGFATPEDQWFRTDARDSVTAVVESHSFRTRRYFNHANLKRHFAEHVHGHRNHSTMLWRCINLELWLRMFIDRQV